MRQLLDEFKDQDLEMTDGLKIRFEDGWVLVVPSSSRPTLLLWAEGESPDRAGALMAKVSDVLSKILEQSNAEESSLPPAPTTLSTRLPEEKAFHFWTGERYLGVRARTFIEFLDTLHYIDSSSLTYHFERGDFSNWVDHELSDAWLASQIRLLESETELKDSLRSSLVSLLTRSVHLRSREKEKQ